MKKIAIEVMLIAWGYLVRIVEQTARGNDFGADGYDAFNASNGFRLQSISSPCAPGHGGRTFFVRGAISYLDLSPLVLPNDEEGKSMLLGLIGAVGEYNARFNLQPKPPIELPKEWNVTARYE